MNRLTRKNHASETRLTVPSARNVLLLLFPLLLVFCTYGPYAFQDRGLLRQSDDSDMMEMATKSSLSVGYLIAPHKDHVWPLSRLLYWGMHRCFGYQWPPYAALSLISLALLFSSILYCLQVHRIPDDMLPLTVPFFLSAMFSTGAIGLFIFVPINFSLALSLFSFGWVVSRSGTPKDIGFLLFALVLAVSFHKGCLLLWPFVLLRALSTNRRVVWASAIALALVVAFAVNWLGQTSGATHGFLQPPNADGGPSTSFLERSLFFFLYAFLSSFFPVFGAEWPTGFSVSWGAPGPIFGWGLFAISILMTGYCLKGMRPFGFRSAGFWAAAIICSLFVIFSRMGMFLQIDNYRYLLGPAFFHLLAVTSLWKKPMDVQRRNVFWALCSALSLFQVFYLMAYEIPRQLAAKF